MDAQWMFDSRNIPDEVMNYLQRIAGRWKKGIIVQKQLRIF